MTVDELIKLWREYKTWYASKANLSYATTHDGIRISTGEPTFEGMLNWLERRNK